MYLFFFIIQFLSMIFNWNFGRIWIFYSTWLRVRIASYNRKQAMIYAYRDGAEAPVPVVFTFGGVGSSSFYAEDWGIFGMDQSDEAAAGLFGVTPDMAFKTTMRSPDSGWRRREAISLTESECRIRLSYNPCILKSPAISSEDSAMPLWNHTSTQPYKV